MANPPKPWPAEYAKSARSSCKSCKSVITKEAFRLRKMLTATQFDGFMPLHSLHYVEPCRLYTKESKSDKVENLPSSDQANISALVKKVPAAKKGKGTEVPEEKHSQSTSTAGSKRKKDVDDDKKSKVTKLEGELKELWAFTDELKKHVTTAELREMLEANGQDATGSELNLRYRRADGMMFGALGKCPMCSGCLHFSGGKWKVPDETNNDFLSKWFKAQKIKKPVRVLPPPSVSSSQSPNGQSQTSKVESLADLKVSIVGLPQESMEEWKGKIKEAGGIVHAKIKNDTNCLVVNGELDGHAAEMRKARRMRLPIVRDDYLVDCFKRQKKLPFDLYKVEAIGEASSMVTVKVKGQSAVHEASGLQDSGHLNWKKYSHLKEKENLISLLLTEKLSNKMLLWHGSRLTNFVGILSQGLRIAPPEAPATGYMGVYFADLVSKSAQYCFADRKNPVGLMLLSEVALGEVYELAKAKYIEKLPKGKHSTKGLGKKVPKKSDSVKWKDDVIVPCDKPVPSNVKESELMYNEYIVYNTAQVLLEKTVT
ncbi:hypothetical protein GQ457_06G028910 [Hibiscus cannabinus]